MTVLKFYLVEKKQPQRTLISQEILKYTNDHVNFINKLNTRYNYCKYYNKQNENMYNQSRNANIAIVTGHLVNMH